MMLQRSLYPWSFISTAIFICVSSLLMAQDGDITIGDVCRVKGQEENTLIGTGIVVGLKGTGDESAVTQRMLARTIQLLGGQVGLDQRGILQSAEFKDAKNVAMVIVQAVIPASGAQQGDRIKCSVSALNAKSLEGGTLLMCPMFGPRPDQPVVYGIASGLLQTPDLKIPTQALIQNGVKMEADIINGFTKGDSFTLVINADHSSFKMAQEIANEINGNPEFLGVDITPGPKPKGQQPTSKYAEPRGQMHVEVKIPSKYANEVQKCIDLVLDLPLTKIGNQKRVVIMEREGIIVVGEDVTIAPVAISHANLFVSTKGAANGANSFVSLAEGAPEKRQKLKSLVDSLNVLAVPTKDIIGIIKAIRREGSLYGELVIE